MQTFFGTFTNKIDAKGRLSVPAPYRAVIQSRGLTSVAVHPSLFESCLEGAGIDRFENVAQKQEDSFAPAARDDLTAAVMADLRELALDGEGRIVLPAEFLTAAKLTDQATFVGATSVFQIWEPALYRAYDDARRARLREKIGGRQ